MSRPANTVGGDFYDILPLGRRTAGGDGRRRRRQRQSGGAADGAAAGDAAHARRREARAGGPHHARSNVQVCRHAPGTRFITLFYAVYQPLDRRPDLRQRGPHAAAAAAARDGTLRAADRTAASRSACSSTRPTPTGQRRRSGRTICSRSTATASPRRRTRRHAVRRDRPRNRAEGQRRERACPRSARRWSSPSNGIPRRSEFADDLTILLLATAPRRWRLVSKRKGSGKDSWP